MAAVCSPRDPLLKKREDFEDILEERRTSSDLRYALRCYAPPLYQGSARCTAPELKGLVLQSDHLHHVIQQVSRETGSTLQEVQGEAAAILEEMAHRLQLSTVRFFAFALSKAFKALFRSIHVNEEGIQRLQQSIQQHPVVLLPSHRSYLDFLLMSYILYSYDVALPVIAAGMDFLGMKFVGEMLRMSGAFFIRRSFGGDKLYWAVFSQYVKTMLKTGYAPVEFFLEGTRSRTCKSLTPKLGLLNIVMEPFLQGEVYDISLVPVSISYERILEEALYARELLGVPKPKESTSGLFKARSVLSEDYGSIHVYFGQPVSVRGLAEGRVNRSQFNLIPRHVPRRPGEDVHRLVNDSAYKLLRAQEENMVLKPWVLLACLLLQNLHQDQDQDQDQNQDQDLDLDLEQLTAETVWLRDLSRHYGAFLDWPDHVHPSLVVSSSLSLHSGLVRVRQGRVRINFGQGVGVEGGGPAVSSEEVLLQRAVLVLSCASYRNQALHVFVRPALLAWALHNTSSSRKEDLFSSFIFLRNLFCTEFALCPGSAVEDFEEACFLLVRTGDLRLTPQVAVVTERGRHTLTFLNSLIHPFIEGYQLVLRFLCEESTEGLTEKRFVPAVRHFLIRTLLSGQGSHTEVLSSDLQKNCLSALLRLGVVEKVKGGPEAGGLTVNQGKLSALQGSLSGERPSPAAAAARL